MKYRIVWKRKFATYVEYLDLKGLKRCLDFLEKRFDDGYELVKVELAED